MARPKGENGEKGINMTQAEADKFTERWLRITSDLKNRAGQAGERKVASYYVIQ